ncbi:MAG: alpha/beta fold hydrolase [Pseudonocardiaceae bacterium]
MAEQDPVLERTLSRDGTPIGYWRSGQGPALVLVHGTTADHSRWESVLPLLEPHATVYAMDRRGRGASSDGPDYSLEAEAADVAAVVDAVAGSTGEPADVLGHSYGAHCALEATLLTAGMRRLVLYEPAVISVAPPGWADQMDGLLVQGRHEEVVVALLRDLAGMTARQLERAKSLPSWPNRVAAAHTVVRETRAEDTYRLDPVRFVDLTVPTLLLAGADSPPDLVASTAALAAALPGARVVTMACQGHVAMLSAPDLFASEVLRFLHSA